MEILFNQFEIKSKMYSMTIYGVTVIADRISNNVFLCKYIVILGNIIKFKKKKQKNKHFKTMYEYE